MVLGSGTLRGGGDGDSCFMMVGPEYFGLSRHWSLSWCGQVRR